MCCKFALKQQTHEINRKMDLILKHLGKHEIGEIVDKHVRKHVESPHTGGSHQSNEFTIGLHGG